jgi:putative ATP-dependent endonuclease of OLD family
MARRFIFPGQENKSKLSRFLCCATIPIDGVDFQPYLEVLLRCHEEQTVADLVVVVTDSDPETPGDRKSQLETLADSFGTSSSCSIFVGHPTLEAELYLPSNAPLLKKAFLDIHPHSEKRWQKDVEARSEDERPMAFVELLRSTRTRKGDFAQRLAGYFKDSPFDVPAYLRAAIEAVANHARTQNERSDS